jgi:hypothetical protein
VIQKDHLYSVLGLGLGGLLMVTGLGGLSSELGLMVTGLGGLSSELGGLSSELGLWLWWQLLMQHAFSRI